MEKREQVLVKIQRPLFSSDGCQDCCAYVVDDETLEQVGNPVFFRPDRRDWKKLFGKHNERCKVYCKGWFNRQTKMIELDGIELTRQDLWA